LTVAAWASRRGRTVAVLGLAVVAAVGCARQGDRDTASSEDGRQSVHLDLADEAFRPTTIGAKGDVPLVLHLRNRGVQHHTFTEDGDGIDVELGPGDERTVVLTSRPAGTDRYFLCRFHEANGMKGKISYVEKLERGGST
jgi:plastocyanin